MKSIFAEKNNFQAQLVQNFLDNIDANMDGPLDSKPETWAIWTDETYQQVVELAERFMNDYPNSYFVGLGDSPSYTVHAIKLLSEKQNLNAKTVHIAHSSGHLFRLITPDPSENLYFNRFPEEWPLNLDKYQDYLTAHELHPKKIMARYNDAGTKTIVMDYFEQGKSLASFFHLMYTWARESGIRDRDFARALLPVAMSHKEIPSPYIKYRDDPLQIKLALVPVSRRLNLTLSSMESDVNRFVPSYSMFDWDKAPREPIQNIARVLEIKQGLQKTVDVFPVRQTGAVPSNNPFARLKKVFG